jgi:hypothetical protein
MVYATQVGMYNIQKFHLKLAIMLLNGRPFEYFAYYLDW